MATGLYGKLSGLYYVEHSSSTMNTALFNNKVLITNKFNNMYALYSETGSYPENAYLFRYGTYYNSVAESLDTFIPKWQLTSGIKIIMSDYNGTVSSEQFTSLFPNFLDVSGYVNNHTQNYISFIVWDGTSNQFAFISFQFSTNYIAVVGKGIYNISSDTLNTSIPVIPLAVCGLMIRSGSVLNLPYMTTGIRVYENLSSTPTDGSVWMGRDRSNLATNIDFFTGFSNDYEPVAPPTDPYSGAGDSTTGGGDGTFDGTSDPVPVPSLPSVGAQDSGFITLFAPTVQQMKDLAHFMWVNPLFDLSAFKKLFADPMDCILGLSVVPVSVPTSGAQNVNIGNLITSVTMNVASQQYIEVDCGTVDFSSRYFGSYLDFEPYTKISIFLPYCGTHQLNADDIIGKTIGVVYHIDILTGSCIAFVKCGDSVLYEFNGACSSNIPVNSLNFASTIENAIRIAVNIGTTVATAGASAPITTGANAAQREAVRQAQQKATKISLAGSTAEGALSMKPNVSRSGALGGGVGLLGHQIPYMIISRPRLCKPANQDFFEGYPSFIQTTIGDLIGKGFTSFTDVIIASQYLTDSEESELEEILQGGVYL